MADPSTAPPVGTVGSDPPSLAMLPLVTLLGRMPSTNPQAYAAPIPGLIHMFAGDCEPAYHAVADGRMLAAVQYQGLDTLVGGAFGVGDGATFALPDLRGRAAIGPSDAMALGTSAAKALAITWMVAILGVFPAGTDMPAMGMVVPYAGREAPAGWLPADGRLLPISDHNALFGLLGTNYGGDGMTDFALPDLRGRVPVGLGPLPDSSYVWFGTQVGETGLGVNHLISAAGSYPTAGDFGQGFVNIGEVVLFAGAVPELEEQDGWFRPDGRLMQIADFPYLYDVIGTRYGGDGVTTFALPDLGGRMIVGSVPSGSAP